MRSWYKYRVRLRKRSRKSGSIFTYPSLNNQFLYELAEQIKNYWSDLRMRLNIADNDHFRISARVTDRAGNENWDDLTL